MCIYIVTTRDPRPFCEAQNGFEPAPLMGALSPCVYVRTHTKVRGVRWGSNQCGAATMREAPKPLPIRPKIYLNRRWKEMGIM